MLIFLLDNVHAFFSLKEFFNGTCYANTSENAPSVKATKPDCGDAAGVRLSSGIK